MSLEEHVSGTFLDIKLEGKLSQPLEKLDGVIYERMRFTFTLIGADVYSISQSIVPVITGFLKSTGSYKVTGRRGLFWSIVLRVIYTAFYAKFVELGTRYFHGRRYLRQAWEFEKPKIPLLIEAAIRSAISEVRI